MTIARKAAVPQLIRTGPIGDNPPGYVTRSARPKHAERFVTVRPTLNDFSIDVRWNPLDRPLRSDEIEYIVQTLTDRLDRMVRKALGGI